MIRSVEPRSQDEEVRTTWPREWRSGCLSRRHILTARSWLSVLEIFFGIITAKPSAAAPHTSVRISAHLLPTAGVCPRLQGPATSSRRLRVAIPFR